MWEVVHLELIYMVHLPGIIGAIRHCGSFNSAQETHPSSGETKQASLPFIPLSGRLKKAIKERRSISTPRVPLVRLRPTEFWNKYHEKGRKGGVRVITHLIIDVRFVRWLILPIFPSILATSNFTKINAKSECFSSFRHHHCEVAFLQSRYFAWVATMNHEVRKQPHINSSRSNVVG